MSMNRRQAIALLGTGVIGAALPALPKIVRVRLKRITIHAEAGKSSFHWSCPHPDRKAMKFGGDILRAFIRDNPTVYWWTDCEWEGL